MRINQININAIHWPKQLFFILMLLFSLNSMGQSGSVTLSLENATVEEALQEIRQQTKVNFVYNNEELSKAERITIKLEKVSLEEALAKVLEGSGLTYVKMSGAYVISPLKSEKQSDSGDTNQLFGTLRGQIIDQDARMPLSFATIQLLHTTKGAVTDIDGYFQIDKIPVGRHDFQVSYVGYKPLVLPQILIGSGKEVVLTIEMVPQINKLGEIVVSAPIGEPLNEMAIVGAKAFSAEETKRYAASISDPARMAQTYAGVSGTDDSTNEISIRGNSPNWLLWRVEGVEVPSPNHFGEEGYSSGAVSVLSANMLGTSDFYTGAFPSDYGNSLSGVFDINLRNGNNQEYEHTIQAGVLGVDLSSEGPFSKNYRGSYLFNYRYSTLSILNNLNIEVSQNALPNYQDLSFKVNLPTKIGKFSIWGIGGLSDVEEKYLPEDEGDYDLGYDEFTESGMYATGITHMIFTDDDSYIQTVLARTLRYSSINYKNMDSLGVLHDVNYDRYKSYATRLSSFYNRKISNQLSLRVGGVISDLDFDFFDRGRDIGEAWDISLNTKGGTKMYQGYINSKYRFSDNVTFSGGLHYTHFALTNANSLEPRAAVAIQMEGNQKISMGYGRHSRHESIPTYFVETMAEDGSIHMPNTNLKLTVADHYVLGYEKLLGNSVNLKTEIYYQQINKLVIPDNPEKYWAPAFGGFNFEDTLSNNGLGRNYGLELTLQRYFKDNYYFLVTHSLFDSKYKAADGKWRNTRFNVNYITNFVGGKEFDWGENKLVGLNAKVIWSGGKRFIPLDLEASISEGEGVFVDEEMFAEKAEDYFRVDLGVSIHFFRNKSEQVLSLDIQNATNRLNTWARIYDSKAQEIINYPMAGLIPVLTYRIEF